MTQGNYNNEKTFHIDIDVYMNNPFIMKSEAAKDDVNPISIADGVIPEYVLEHLDMFVMRVALRLRHAWGLVHIKDNEAGVRWKYRIYGNNEEQTANIEVLIITQLANSEDMIINDTDGQSSISLVEIKLQSIDLGIENSYSTYTCAVRAIEDVTKEIKRRYLGSS